MARTDTLEPKLKQTLRRIPVSAEQKKFIKGKIMSDKKEQKIPDGKVKNTFFLRDVTNARINAYAEKMGIRPGAVLDLIFSDEALISDLMKEHATRIMEELSKPLPQ